MRPSTPEIAEALDVDAIVEGSVFREGARVRITAQLIDAESGYHLWSQTYDRELADIFAVQDEISTEIVKALKVTLGAEEEAPVIARAAPPAPNTSAGRTESNLPAPRTAAAKPSNHDPALYYQHTYYLA